ncbi:Uncharacterised protein g5830 [Pycnogonum litorale]
MAIMLLLISWLPSIAPGQTSVDIVNRPSWKPSLIDSSFVPRPVNLTVSQLLPVKDITYTKHRSDIPVVVIIKWKIDSTNSRQSNDSTFRVAKYEVTYQQLYVRTCCSYRVIIEVPGYRNNATLDHLQLGKWYRCTVTSVSSNGRHRNRSKPVEFFTTAKYLPRYQNIYGNGESESSKESPTVVPTFMTVRNEEIFIVTGVLIFWFIVIALFINKWGKIRMLEPYQPDYKPTISVSPLHVRSSKIDLSYDAPTERRYSRIAADLQRTPPPQVIAQVHHVHSTPLTRKRHLTTIRQSSDIVEATNPPEVVLARQTRSVENIVQSCQSAI